MRWNLAILSPNRADGVIKEHEEIKHWYIGGHSLGGVMAASYAEKNAKIQGLALYAAYPMNEKLQHTDLAVLSIYGSMDGVAKMDKVKNAALPDDARFHEIIGGNHGYFGSYGMQ